MTNQLNAELSAIADHNGFSVNTVGQSRVTIFVPTSPQRTSPVEIDNAKIFARDYMLKLFGAVNQQPSIEGFWINPDNGVVYPDDIVSLWVDCPEGGAIKSAKKLYFLAEVLCTLLNQYCIYVSFFEHGQFASVVVNHPNPAKLDEILAE